MLYEHWCHIAAKQPQDVALRDTATGRRWTFGELHAAGETYNSGKSKIVYPQGHTPEFVFAVLNAWRTGKIACPIESGQTPTIGRDALPRVQANWQVSPTSGLSGIIHLKTTSATTGAARYVAFTPAQLAADAENVVTTMGLRPDWPNLGVISMAHSYGFSNLVLPLLLHGIPLILVPSPLPETVRQAAASEKAVTLPAVPALWRAWQDAGSIPSNVKLAISAGAPLPLVLEQEIFAKCGLKIHNFYGSTECGGITYDTTEEPRSDDAYVGSPMQNVNLSVNENGCLVVRSHAVGESYWGEATDEPVGRVTPCAPSTALAGKGLPALPKLAREYTRPTSSTLGNGCFHTSDLVELKGNEVFLRGRASDLINVAGRKVSPVIIERELVRHPAVSACLIFGVPDRESERGDLIVACVVASSPVTGEALKQFLLERIPAWQMPRDWWFVESLLPNRVGKVSRMEWRERWLGKIK